MVKPRRTGWSQSSEALVEIKNLGGPFTDPEQLTRFMHLCLTLAGEELLDGNRTNGLAPDRDCVYSGGPFGTASGEEDHPDFLRWIIGEGDVAAIRSAVDEIIRCGGTEFQCFLKTGS